MERPTAYAAVGVAGQAPREVMTMSSKEELTNGEEEIAFYYYVGNAISEWSWVEQTLLGVVLSCIENRGEEDVTHRALSVGFLSIEGFRAKIDFAEGVVSRYVVRHALKENGRWDDLVKRTRAASSLRNKLAHWTVTPYPLNSMGRRYLLTPYIFQKKKYKRKGDKPTPPDGSQGLRDVSKMRAEFICLAIALQNFAARVRGETLPHPEDHEQPGHPPRIGKLKVQILEGLARLLRPSGGKPESKEQKSA